MYCTNKNSLPSFYTFWDYASLLALMHVREHQDLALHGSRAKIGSLPWFVMALLSEIWPEECGYLMTPLVNQLIPYLFLLRSKTSNY